MEEGEFHRDFPESSLVHAIVGPSVPSYPHSPCRQHISSPATVWAPLSGEGKIGLGYPFLCSLLPFHHPSWALASGVRTPLVRTKGAILPGALPPGSCIRSSSSCSSPTCRNHPSRWSVCPGYLPPLLALYGKGARVSLCPGHSQSQQDMPSVSEFPA